jgi:hypothetical protein
LRWFSLEYLSVVLSRNLIFTLQTRGALGLNYISSLISSFFCVRRLHPYLFCCKICLVFFSV